MGLHALLVGRLRPELGVSGRHDGLPVADLRHPDAVQSAVAELAGPDGAVFVTCQWEDLAEVRRVLAFVSVGLRRTTAVVEPIPGTPLAVAVGSALIGGAGGDAGTEQQLAAFDRLRSELWSALWLPRVHRLRHPAPRLRQHARGWLPGRGFLAVYDDAPRVLSVRAERLGGLSGAPDGAMLVTADAGAPGWVHQAVADAVAPMSVAELRSWRHPADAYGVSHAAEFALVPAPLLDVARLPAEVVTVCGGCGRRHPRPACPFCGMAATRERVLAGIDGGARP